MPNVRAEIFRQIASQLAEQARAADHAVRENKFQLARLVKQQGELKKKRAELHRLHAEFTKKGIENGTQSER